MRRRSLHLPRRGFIILAAIAAVIVSVLGATSTISQPSTRNAIIFVADGLRPSSINETDAPTLLSIRQKGVHFVNSHSLFPTFTTPNASAIATGHYLGDTGDFSNTIYAGFPVANAAGSVTPFIENDGVLSDLEDFFPGANFLNEEALLALARQAGFNTAAVGKLGPIAIQDVTQANRVNGVVPQPSTVIVDDSTGKSGGIPLRSDIAAAIQSDTYFASTYVPTYTTDPTIAPGRTNGAPACTTPGVPATCRDSNGFSGNNTTPGTDQPNTFQQKYFADVTTRAILPTFKQQGKPFVTVFWSRDPDGTQHNQGDSLGKLSPGINGPTARAAVKNADNNLKQILAALKQLGLEDSTDVFITADHGFSTISKSVVDRSGALTKSYAATQTYTGVNPGFLPVGFVAIDIAHHLNLPLYDPDTPVVKLDPANGGNVTYALVKPSETPTPTQVQRPANGNGVIGGTGQVVQGKTDGKIVIAANGGSDLIYLPNGNPSLSDGKSLAETLVDFLSSQDYISGIFADDSFGKIPGALPLSAINLKGSALTPVPAIVVNFSTFSVDPKHPLRTGVEIADSGLQQGQGMHGSFSRADTYNNMAAIGPDFKRGFKDLYPVSNADVPLTIANILNLEVPSKGKLQGRVIKESLVNGSKSQDYTFKVLNSETNAVSKQRTVLYYQKVGKTKYFDAAGFPGRTVGLLD